MLSLSKILFFCMYFTFIVTNAYADWPTVVVDSNEVYSLSSAVDSNNKVHIVYGDKTNNDLKYATNASGLWTVAPLDTDGNVGGSSSIAIDPLNHIHIAYLDQSNASLNYATNASGSWTISVLDKAEGSYYGMYCSIALDSNGKVHISYTDYLKAVLRYITNQTGPWVATTLKSTGGALASDNSTTIAVDSTNKVHITASDYLGVHYLTNKSGSWVVTTLDTKQQGVSMVIDGNDQVYICYGNQYYIYQGSSWIGQVYASDGYGGKIKRDSANKLHIVYYSDSSGDFKYATNASGSWLSETIVTPLGNAIFFNSMNIDLSGRKHVAYYDPTNKTLNYATSCDIDPVQIAGSFYTSVQAAYNAAATGSTVQIQNQLFTENVLLNRDIMTIFNGGYDCGYTAQTGNTTIDGSLIIKNGSVTIENLIIK